MSPGQARRRELQAGRQCGESKGGCSQETPAVGELVAKPSTFLGKNCFWALNFGKKNLHFNPDSKMFYQFQIPAIVSYLIFPLKSFKLCQNRIKLAGFTHS